MFRSNHPGRDNKVKMGATYGHLIGFLCDLCALCGVKTVFASLLARRFEAKLR